MNKNKDTKYLLESLDRLGLVLVGMWMGSAVGIVGRLESEFMFGFTLGLSIILLLWIEVLNRKLKSSQKSSQKQKENKS